MSPEILDLDELAELNPPERTFRVGGRELVLRELPHAAYFKAARLAGGIQDRAMAGEYAMGELERLNKALLLKLYGPANPWLEEADEQTFQKAMERHHQALDEWGKSHAPKGRGSPASADMPVEPRREDFIGVFFDAISPRKLAFLSTEALKVGMPQLDEVQPNLPPEVAAAVTAAKNRGRAMNASPGNGHTNR